MMESHDGTDIAEQLESTRAALVRSERLALAGRFAGSVMHEVNNPLEALGNLVYLARHEADNGEAVRRFLAMAEEQLSHVQDIARRALAFYRASTTEMEVDLMDLLNSALKMHGPRVVIKQIEVQRRQRDGVSVKANAGELLQVFTNLIGNSIDALADGGTLNVRITRTGDQVHILIADNGCGIPPAQQQRLFEPFATSNKENGTGLGLWMSKTLVEKHKGRIRHRSSTKEGCRGTAFRISLPR